MSDTPPFEWGEEASEGDAPDETEYVGPPGYTDGLQVLDLWHAVWRLYKCGLTHRCLSADLLDGQHGTYYTTKIAGTDVANPNVIGGTGVTINVSGSDITINADNNGDVSGPATSTNNALAVWSGAGGDTLQDSGVKTDDDGEALIWPGETINTPSNVDLSANAQEDDYTGFNGATVIHVTAVHSSGSTMITGIAGGVEGRYLRIRNLSGNELVLDHDDSEGGSVDANHILLTAGVDLAVGDGEVVQLEYAGSRWRQI